MWSTSSASVIRQMSMSRLSSSVNSSSPGICAYFGNGSSRNAVSQLAFEATCTCAVKLPPAVIRYKNAVGAMFDGLPCVLGVHDAFEYQRPFPLLA